MHFLMKNIFDKIYFFFYKSLKDFSHPAFKSFNFAKGVSFPYTLTAIEISGKFDRCLRNLARLGQTPRDLSAKKIPFPRSKGEKGDPGREERASSKEGGFTFMEMPGPACKYLATTVRTPINFQPVFNFAKTEHRPRIELFALSDELFLSNQRKHLPFASVPPGEKLVVPSIRFRVSFVFGWNDLLPTYRRQ